MDLDLSQIKATFFIEAREILEEMERSLLSLEASPGDSEALNSLFRAAHTIKGSSGIMGVESIEKFTHVVENLLTKARDNEISLSEDAIGLLLECKDHIADLVEVEASGAAIPIESTRREGSLVDRLNELLGEQGEPSASSSVAAEEVLASGDTAGAGTWHISLRLGPDVLRHGMDPISFINYLARLGELISVVPIFESMPAIDEMDPESCYLGLEIGLKTDFEKKDIESVFEFMREDCTLRILPPHSKAHSYVELIEGLPEDSARLGEILVKGGALTQTELDGALKAQARVSALTIAPSIGEVLVDSGVVEREVLDAAVAKQKKAVEVRAKETSTIRIDADKLDALVNLVGELVISNAAFDQHAHRLSDGALSESASSMTRLVEDIRDISMQLRMVPIGDTFGKFNRVVRDISKELGKEIDLIIEGGDTELDKTVVEKISDPLMHLVRNSVDHGIETPDVRVAAGKPKRGTVHLNAYNDAGSIVIEISDDGRGLNRDKILDKAVSNGLATAGAQLTDRQIFGFIFEPGFSTAEKITKVSGRGVGMDVVRRNIEALRGTVEIDSTDGAGAAVRIRLPLTLAIIDGFMVGIGDANYVMPLDMVVECLELSRSQSMEAEQKNYINLRGEVLPYISLRTLFNENGPRPERESVVVVQHAQVKTGLVVDTLFGEVQTVIKSLGRAYKDIQGLSGATILGTGKVALILDVPRLVQLAEAEMSARLLRA